MIPTLVKSACLVVSAGALPLLSAVKPVWVHGGDDGDVRGVHQLRDGVHAVKCSSLKFKQAPRNSQAVSLEQRLCKVAEHLSPHGLIAVHVGYIAHHGLQQLPRAWNGGGSLADMMPSHWSHYT